MLDVLDKHLFISIRQNPRGDRHYLPRVRQRTTHADRFFHYRWHPDKQLEPDINMFFTSLVILSARDEFPSWSRSCF